MGTRTFLLGLAARHPHTVAGAEPSADVEPAVRAPGRGMAVAGCVVGLDCHKHERHALVDMPTTTGRRALERAGRRHARGKSRASPGQLHIAIPVALNGWARRTIRGRPNSPNHSATRAPTCRAAAPSDAGPSAVLNPAMALPTTGRAAEAADVVAVAAEIGGVL